MANLGAKLGSLEFTLYELIRVEVAGVDFAVRWGYLVIIQ